MIKSFSCGRKKKWLNLQEYIAYSFCLTEWDVLTRNERDIRSE